ncbi:hypothetical protein HY450_00255 [Candidatus Pacearchaeota archaeon]|nr:hypothetical protein [Candidatus Pacearchaeota archaeon]
MKILYGVCGEGFGHSSRAKSIISFLEREGHEILVVTYGQAYSILKNFNILKVNGISLFFERGRLSWEKTVKNNLTKLNKNKWRLIKKKIDDFEPEICISDMEPVVPIVSFFYKLPLISIDNQHRLTHLKINVQQKYKKDFYLAKLAVQRCVARADYYIILSFVKQKSKDKRARILSPILREEIVKLKPSKKNFVLVYLTKKNKKMLEVLRKIEESFVVYGYDKKLVKGNLRFKKTGEKFMKDLAEAKAVIATAGFTLISESMYLKKPYFAIPLRGQFEQTLNALQLKEFGIGDFSENPTREEIEYFLGNLGRCENKLKTMKMNPNEVFSVLKKVLRKFSN